MAGVADGNPIVLRRAQPADSGRLAKIAQEAYKKYLGLVDEPPAPMLLDYDEVAASGRTYVAVESGEVLGMVTIEMSGHHLILRNLAVLPSSQGQGIGRTLTSLVEERARRESLQGVRLWTRAEMHDNIAFYTALGYVLTHSERTETANRVHFLKQFDREAERSRVR